MAGRRGGVEAPAPRGLRMPPPPRARGRSLRRRFRDHRAIMIDSLIAALAFAAALGSGVIGGVFYAFSTFVMRALRRRPAGEAVAAMQAINVAVINPLFLGVFLGTAAACAVIIVSA